MDRLRGGYRSTGKNLRELLSDSLWFLSSEGIVMFGVRRVRGVCVYVRMCARRAE